MRVLGAIDMAEGDTQRDRIRAVAAMTFTDEDGNPRQFTWRTIETWLMRYNKHGLTALAAQGRSDKGKLRKVTLEEIMEAVRTVRPAFHSAHPQKQAVYRLCIEQGLLQRERIAPNTFSRLVTSHEMLKPDAETQDKHRLAFAKAHANEMWQGDTMFGPHVRVGGGMAQSKLIAFVDDASRVCVNGAFFAREDVDSLIEALSCVFYKRGVPESMYVDNGSIYTSREIVQICARLGCILTHTPVRDGAAKGKIERFFRTVREQFLCRPLDRFALDRRRIRYLPPNEVNEELFFAEEDRVVKADNTFPLMNVRYEAPRHLPSRTIQVRYQRK